MRQTFAALMVAVGACGLVQAEETKYSLNGENTKIEWTGTKADGKHDGGFKQVKGTATLSDGSNLKFDVEIDCGSLYSDDPKLTQHLKSPDLFSVKDHPKAKFKSTKIEKTSDGTQVTGDLTILGKTKKVTFPAEIKTGDTLAIKAAFNINRQDFGMTYGTGKINDDVEVRVDLKAKR
ncbi:YceI family protein [Schlesneria paludicola]|uniref:YceI family protein n=1 Tax=Schlesneria paludicola TaxID=360056 RepID=UPI00029B00A4|nr:YceI family protein [Schlesneria paludicola]